MSIVKIRASLETALATITPAIATAYENMAFVPVAWVPYQKCFLLSATPQNPTMGDVYHREIGIFQISLMYPIQVGTAAAAARAIPIQQLFRQGATFSNGGVNTMITNTPEISGGAVDGDRWSLIVRCRYQAEIFT